MLESGVIDALQFARSGATLEGTLYMSALSRVAEMQVSTEGLAYGLRGRIDSERRRWIGFSVVGAVHLTCQRCLEPLRFPIDLRGELLLASSIHEIEQAEDDIDRLLATRITSVAKLIEDEVILALPMVPKHEHCDVVPDDTDIGGSHPFAALGR